MTAAKHETTLRSYWETRPAATEDQEFVTQRRDDLLEIRRQIDSLMTLQSQLPNDHNAELPEGIIGTACSLLDSLRCYRTAPGQFFGEASELAATRQQIARKAKDGLDNL